jgi:hypothetical protein
MATPLAQAEYERLFETLTGNRRGRQPVHATLAIHWARVVELVFACEALAAQARDDEITSDTIHTPRQNLGERRSSGCRRLDRHRLLTTDGAKTADGSWQPLPEWNGILLMSLLRERLLARPIAKWASTSAPTPTDAEQPDPGLRRCGRTVSGPSRAALVSRVAAKASRRGLDAETGREEPWKELMPADPAGIRATDQALISPDGKHYVYSSARAERGDEERDAAGHGGSCMRGNRPLEGCARVPSRFSKESRGRGKPSWWR